MATITFEDATQASVILPWHYVAITMPKDRQVLVTEKETGVSRTQKFTVKAGERQLWRLTEDFKLWGMPTKETLALCGKVGFNEGPDTMHRVIRELYDMPGTFETAQACSLPKKEYPSTDIQKAYQEGRKYERQDEVNMRYWLASRWGYVGSTIANFRVFRVGSGSVYAFSLYNSSGGTNYNTYAVRPEATPKPTLLLEREECDGSYEHPWICLSK